MKLTINIALSDDFKQVCEIFDFYPESVVQRFVNEVSFPVFFGRSTSHHRWATFFFLDYLGAANGDLAEKLDKLEPFLDKIGQSIRKDEDENEKAVRKVMIEWHRSVLRERSEALLNALKDDDKDG